MLWSVSCYKLRVCVCMHDTLIHYGVERHMSYAVCMEYGRVQCVIEDGVERHLPYVVCV